MFKKTLALILALLLALGACACAETITDMYGREVVLSEPVTRMVVLSAADCEILCALGCEDLLVGRGEYCDYPETILDLPALTTGANTNLEEILALAPQVVVMSDMAQTQEQVDTLEANGVRVVLSDANTISQVYEAITMLGALTGKNAEAQALVDDMAQSFEDLSASSETAGKSVYFEVSPLRYGLWTAGKGTFLDELAEICGLTNAFADVEGWNAISEEQVLERNPDFIVTVEAYMGEGATPVEEIMSREAWQGLSAVQNGKVFNADPNATSRPGPRLKDAAIELYKFVSAE